MKMQYARSAHKEVIRVVRHNREGQLDWVKKAVAWATAQGSKDGAFYPIRFGGSSAIGTLPLKDPPKGWVKPNRSKGYRPRRSTPLWREMDAIRFEADPVPGLPDHFTAPRREGGDDDFGSSWIMWPYPFLWEGAAWVRLGHMPTEGDFGPQWVEVKASKLYIALEAHDAAAKAATSVQAEYDRPGHE